MFFLLFGLFAPGEKAMAQYLQSSPAFLTGVVTNAANGIPIIGAKIQVQNHTAYSVAGGVYSLAIEPTGTFPVQCAKAGFDAYVSAPVLFQPGITATLPVSLLENLNPPGTVSASLDTLPQVVHISWTKPAGNYELIYDDGLQDAFTVWGLQGNLNAIKCNPPAYPAKVTGGSIHIGQASNYPSGSNPLVPFQVKFFDASGPNGLPGNVIAGPFDVLPTAFGWVEFLLPVPVQVNSGSFYMAMIQGGNAPNAAGLAVDETSPQLRSYSRFVSGGGPWLPAQGNYMMRMLMIGPGGPLSVTDQPGSLVDYQVWRLRQGEEQNPLIWVSVGATGTTQLDDPSWPSLPCSPYRWGVKAHFSGNRWSPPVFSNIIGKCWTTQVTIHVDLSCDAALKNGISAQLKNSVYPDTIYSALLDTSGIITFPSVWKGTYEITVNKFGYQDYSCTIPLSFNDTIDVVLLQHKSPPANLVVNNKSLQAIWDVPHYEETLFSEDWSSGNFTANGWTPVGANWAVSSTLGNPAPSALFNWSPQATNYSQFLISRQIAAVHSPSLKMKFDIFLDSFGTTTINQMAVEIWNGSNWNTLKSFDNSCGDIPWTAEEMDISAYTGNPFKIRFRATGGNSFDLNGWNLDNIAVIAAESSQSLAPCILGYNFYLDNILLGYNPENIFKIPGNQVQYGNLYNACVLAVYGSGYSTAVCDTFTSGFLYPPRNFTAVPVEDVAFLTWEKPEQMLDQGGGTPPGLIGYVIYRDDTLLVQIASPDTLYYYNNNLEPGIYQYAIAALYDLTPYGFPGLHDESARAGPVPVIINFGRPLPFYEDWNMGSFSYQDWRFIPDQGNWSINTTEGNPAPSAMFSWQPPCVSYSSALESPALDGFPFDCASIWLDFDMQLTDRTNSGTERMVAEVFYNNIWHKKAEFVNNGNLAWTTYHLDISPVKKKGFRIRFRALGENSAEILQWELDNIHVYAVCYPPENLFGQPVGNDVHLSWSPPRCNGSGLLLDEGFEEAGFPPLSWSLNTTNPNYTWEHTGVNSPVGVHSGNYSAGLLWEYEHQDEWLIVNNVYVGGNLRFWSFAYQGSTHQDHYYVKLSLDGGLNWLTLLDLSALPPYLSPNGYNEWNEPYLIDMTYYLGETVTLAWQAVDGDNQGLWYYWAIDDCYMGADKLDLSNSGFLSPTPEKAPSYLEGYNIYRKGKGIAEFVQINTGPVHDTLYVDAALPEQEYSYYIESVFSECPMGANSDTIVVDVISGVDPGDGTGFLSIFPNPAREVLHIHSKEPVYRVDLLSSFGQPVRSLMTQDDRVVTLNLAGLSPGLYLVDITLPQGHFRRKVFLLL